MEERASAVVQPGCTVDLAGRRDESGHGRGAAEGRAPPVFQPECQGDSAEGRYADEGQNTGQCRSCTMALGVHGAIPGVRVFPPKLNQCFHGRCKLHFSHDVNWVIDLSVRRRCAEL